MGEQVTFVDDGGIELFEDSFEAHCDGSLTGAIDDVPGDVASVGHGPDLGVVGGAVFDNFDAELRGEGNQEGLALHGLVG